LWEAFRSSAQPASWCPIPARHGSTPSIEGSTSRRPQGSITSVSEAAIARFYGLPEIALIEMGDFVGEMLKYLKAHPVPRVTIAGGFAQLSKLAAGRFDLHSKRGTVDFPLIESWLRMLGANPPLWKPHGTQIARRKFSSICNWQALGLQITSRPSPCSRRVGRFRTRRRGSTPP
jgi:CbiD